MLFRSIGLSPAQLVPNAMGLMVALFVLLRTLGESFTAANVFAVFSFAKSGDTPGMFYVNQRPSYRIFRSMISSNGPAWKSRWVFLRFRRIEGMHLNWHVPSAWRTTPIQTPPEFTRPRNMPAWTKQFKGLPLGRRLYPYGLIDQPMLYLSHFSSVPVYVAGNFDLGKL